MEEIGLIFSHAVVEALSRVDASTLIFLIIAILVQMVVILFLVIVTPIWIVRHYNARKYDAMTLVGRQKLALDELEQAAEYIEGRMTSIETILDADVPKWKERSQ